MADLIPPQVGRRGGGRKNEFIIHSSAIRTVGFLTIKKKSQNLENACVVVCSLQARGRTPAEDETQLFKFSEKVLLPVLFTLQK